MGAARIFATSMTQSTSDKIYVSLFVVSLWTAGNKVSSGNSGGSNTMGPSSVEGDVPKGQGMVPTGVEGEAVNGDVAQVKDEVR